MCNPSGRHLDGDLSRVEGNLNTGEPLRLDMSQIKACRAPVELFNDPEIDVVDICTPTSSHPSLATAALAAGKHVLCEKPLARTSLLARQMVDAAQQARGFFMPAMCLRFWPQWFWVKQQIESGAFGRVLAARFRRVAEPPGWSRNIYFDGARSGGALLDLHVHDVDFVQFCFGRPESVWAAGYSRFSGAVDHVMAHYRVATGALVSAEGSWTMTKGFGFNMAYTVQFESATADYDLARGTEALRLYEEGKAPQTIQCEGPDGFVGELTYFVEAVEKKEAPTRVTAQEGLSAVEICEAEQRSVQTGQWIGL